LQDYEKCALAACFGDLETFYSLLKYRRPMPYGLRTTKLRRLYMKATYIAAVRTEHDCRLRQDNQGCTDFFSVVIARWNAAVAYRRYAETRK